MDTGCKVRLIRLSTSPLQGVGEHGVPGLVNLFGIGSPGITSSLAIAELVRGMLPPVLP